MALLLAAAGCRRESEPPPLRPDVLLILVDALRADHLPSYGYPRDTAPGIARTLVEPGVLFEHAYAQASWTPPSVASLLTGFDPADMAPDDLRSFGVPTGVPTLAGRLAAAGYATAAFVGNPLVHDGAGFAQGFESWWQTPGSFDSFKLHGDTVLEPALSWLAQPRDPRRPYFLYVHFIDPHDPYTSPDLVEGRSEFLPEYAGGIRGDDVHGLTEGTVELEDLEQDVRQLTALYDSEIRYVDRVVTRLVEAATARQDRETLVVLVSDHGEELYDHGGWTHGRTVYEEIVRVPLIFRLDGRFAAGRRVDGNVRLLDVAPTLVAAAGADGSGLEGTNLLPLLLDPRARPPRTPILVRHWQAGPLRAALLVDRRKTLVFDRREPFTPLPGLEENLTAVDAARLRRVESYDLSRDPGEQRPLAVNRSEARQLIAELEPDLNGLRLLVDGLPPGSSVRGRLRWRRSGAQVRPFLLDARDEYSFGPEGLEFELHADDLPKGFLVVGRLGALERLELAATGLSSAELVTELGSGRRWLGRPIPPRRLVRADRPHWSGRPELKIWSRAAQQEGATDPAAEQRAIRRLRAVGYL